MSLYGYARVSTLDQDLSIQRAGLKAAGCEVIRAEKASAGRSELQVLLDFLRPGDTPVVTRIDRLARSLKDLQDIVHELKSKRCCLESDRAAGRHRRRGREGVPRHARCVCRIRNQSAPRAPVGRD